MNVLSAFLDKFNKYGINSYIEHYYLKNKHGLLLPYLPKNITLVKTVYVF